MTSPVETTSAGGREYAAPGDARARRSSKDDGAAADDDGGLGAPGQISQVTRQRPRARRLTTAPSGNVQRSERDKRTTRAERQRAKD